MIFTDPQEREDVLQACRCLRSIAEELPVPTTINATPADELRKSVADMRNMLAVLVTALENQP